MKKIIGIVVIVGLALLAYRFIGSFSGNTGPAENHVNTVTPSESVLSYCSSQDLQTTLGLDHGAGNVYGVLTIKNISDKPCQVIGSNFIVPTYDKQVAQRIEVKHIGSPESALFHLSPNQTLYSQIHYPNGPQCSSSTQTVNVTFEYAVSPTETVVFADQQGKTEQSIPVCASVSEVTTITVWNISSHPIVP